MPVKRFIANMKGSPKPGKIIKGISLTVLEPAYNALGGIPIPVARTAIGAVLDLIKGIETTSRNSAILAELEKHIQFLTEILKPLGEIDRYNLPSGLEDDVGKLSTELETVSSAVKSKSSAGAVRRFLERREDEHDLRTFAQKLGAALDRFHLSQTLRQAKALLLSERSRAVMSLPRADYAGHDSGREGAPEPCLEKTRVEILAEIMSWLESANSKEPSIYWLNALAGIGKSTIAKSIAQKADQNGMLGGSFFFSQSGGPLCDPLLVFPTLAFQLAQSDEFKIVIGEAIQQDGRLGHREPFSQLEGLILNPLRQLGSHRRNTLIVLDALDECEGKGAATILRLLLSHATGIPFLRILITARPELHISSVFDEFDEGRTYTQMILHNIPTSVIQWDINHYIRTELAKIPKELGLHNMAADWTTDKEIDTLVEKSGNLFVYAAISIRFIRDNHVGDPRAQLRLILGAQISEESTVTPYAQLDDLYVRVLLNSLSEFNRNIIVTRFQKVVGSIVLLREPLPLRSLAQFVQYEMDTIDVTLRHLRSIIIAPSTADEAPRIYHPSFLDFITNAARRFVPDLVIVPVPDQERRHALRCFELMAGFLEPDMTGILDLSLLNSEVDGFEQKVRHALSLEVQYACRYWASHLSRVEFGDETIVQALKEFSEGSILMWFEAMSLIGSIAVAVSSIHRVCRWAISSNCELALVTILHDAYRFILAHAEVIRAGALHVYHSALAFTPHDTALYRTYSRRTKNSISVLQGVESRWPRNLGTLLGHSGMVTSIAFSPDSLRLASGSDDCTLRLWDAISGVHIATLEGHIEPVTSVTISPDSLRLASGSNDHTLRLWDAVSGVRIATLEGHTDSVTSVAFSPDGLRLASGSNDRTLRLWNAMSGAPIATLKGHADMITSVAFSPDGPDGFRLASSSYDGTLRWWNGMSGVPIATLGGRYRTIRSIAFSRDVSRDGSRLASGCDDGTVQLWNGISRAHIATLEGHSDWVTAIAFSPDGSRLASGSDDHTLRLWDAVSGAPIATLKGHSAMVTSVAFSPDGLRLASGSGDRTLRLWDGLSGAHIATLKGHSNSVTSVAFSPDGLQLASASLDETVRLWDAMPSARIANLEGHSNSVNSLAFSSDGLQLLSQTDAETFAWDLTSEPPSRLDSGSLTATFAPTVGLDALIWSTDGPWIQVRHPKESRATRICYIPTLYVPSTTVQTPNVPTQSQISVGCADGRVIILDMQHHPFVRRARQVATS